MTEVLIHGKRCTVRAATLVKYNKIKALHDRGYTVRKIKTEMNCSAKTIQDALGYVPNGVPKKKEQMGTSQLSKPPTPPIQDSVPIRTGTNREQDEKAMWTSYEATKRTSPRFSSTPLVVAPQFKSTNDFMLWAKTEDITKWTGHREKALKRIQVHERDSLSEGTVDLYIHFCKNVKPPQEDLMIELKAKLKQRNGGT